MAAPKKPFHSTQPPTTVGKRHGGTPPKSHLSHSNSAPTVGKKGGFTMASPMSRTGNPGCPTCGKASCSGPNCATC
jgi:hypothetical protein